MEKIDLQHIRLGSIWNSGRGASFKIDDFEADFKAALELGVISPLTGNLLIIRMKDGVTALISGLELTAKFECVRCLDSFDSLLQIKDFERHFYEALPERDFDPAESFLINKSELSIDLTEAFRQEIILQFPINPLCSERCAGLCQICHANLNRPPKNHSCKVETEQSDQEEVHRPFANLKNLLK